MAREVINVGAAPNDGQGDPIRTSFIKTNNNFGELYARAQENPPGSLIGSVGDQAGMYAYDSNYFYYCFQDYDGSSVIWAEIPNTVIDAIEIANGTSNVSIPTANGNVTVSVANVANVAVFSSGGANFTAITANSAVINGDLTVTGNATLSGNIVGDRITNGTTSIEIPVTNGNATVTVGNIANVAVFTSSGLVANVISATGNVVGLNLTTPGVITATGNITGGNVSAAGNISAAIVSASGNLVGGNLVIPNGSRIRGDFSSGVVQGRSVFQTSNVSVNAPTIISSVPGENNANTLASGFGARSSPDLGNSAVFGVYSYANQGAVRSLSVGTVNANPITFLFDSTEVARLTTGGNLGIGNTTPLDPLAVTGTAYVSGNITGGNIVTAGSVSAAALTVNGTSTFAGNVMPAANITYDLGNSTNRWNDIWLANSTIYLGNAQLSANASALILTNPSGGQTVFSGSQSLISATNFSASGDVTGGNILTGGIVSAVGNITSSGGIFIGNGSGLTGVVAIANVGAASQFTNGTTSLNVPVADGNIIGNIGGSTNLFEFSTVGLSAAGNVTANNINAGNLITATGSVTAGNLVSSGILSVTGNATLGNIFITGSRNVDVGNNRITNVATPSSGTDVATKDYVDGQVSSGFTIQDSTANTTVVATGDTLSLLGTANQVQVAVTGADQVTFSLPNAISISGNVTGGNLITSGSITATGNVTGGNIRTIGAVSATGNVTGNCFIGNGSQLTGITAVAGVAITNGTSNVTVALNGNITVGVGGTSGITTFATTGQFVTGLLSATGNITGGNLSGTNIVGTLTTAAQTNITSVGTLISLDSGAISSSGNVTGANILTGGIVSATGNITGGNILGGANVNATTHTGATVSVTGLVTAGNLTVGTGNASVGNIVNNNANGVGNIGSSGTYFNTVFATASTALYADLAERYLADQHYAAGTVVAFGGSQEITRCDNDHDVLVAGIVSDRPAYEMNAGLVGDHPTAIALAGRVPCLVQGPVRRGDMLVSAGGGRARAEANPRMGSVIGKALEDFDGTTGTIEVVVGRI